MKKKKKIVEEKLTKFSRVFSVDNVSKLSSSFSHYIKMEMQ